MGFSFRVLCFVPETVRRQNQYLETTRCARRLFTLKIDHFQLPKGEVLFFVLSLFCMEKKTTWSKLPALLTALVWTTTTFAVAQTQQPNDSQLQWPVVRHTIKNGLPGMQCMSVFKDNRGVVWIGTKAGLSRFNGEKFENFGIKDGLLGEYITVVGQDPQGYVWFNCAVRGLMRFDGQHFKQYLNPSPDLDTQAHMEQDGTINVSWATPNGRKVHKLKNNVLRPFDWTGVPADIQRKIRDISLTKNKGQYLFTADDGLWLYKNKQLRALAKGTFGFCEAGKLVYGDVFVELRRADGGKDILVWDGQSLRLVMTTRAQAVDGKMARTIKVVRQLPYDYVFDFAGSIYLLEKNSYNCSVIYADNPANEVAYQDTPGKPDAIRYIATEKGLLGLVKNGFKSFTEQAVPYTWSVVEDKVGHYWFLNYEKSLQKYDGRTITEVTDHPKEVQSNEWYYHALKDKFGHLWLPNVHGVVRYDGQRYTNLLKAEKVRLAFALAENKAQNTVAACTFNGVFMIDTRPPHSYRKQRDTTTIFKNLVGCAVVSPGGAYWFGGYGVARYDSLKHQTVYYNRDNKKLNAGGIMSLFFDSSGTLWAGSSRKGLFRFNAKKDVFEQVFGRWLNGMVPFVEQLDPDHLLIADQTNLYAVSLKDTNQVRCFNQNNGFVGIELGQLGSFKDSKGQIWITSGSVLSVLDPAQLDLTPASLRVSIVQVSRTDAPPLRLPFVGKATVVQLPFGQNNVSFTVEALGEDKPFRTQYSYRIREVLDKWSEWQTQDLISLTNLPAGTFTLEVKARRGVLADESAVAKVDFEVSMYFWRSPFFYVYAALAGLFLLGCMVFLWRRQDRQARKIEERERQVRFLQVQTIQAQMNPHFIFNALATVQNSIVNNQQQKAVENLMNLSILIRNFLEASIITDNNESSIFKSEILLSTEIELIKLYVEFEQLQYEDRFEFSFLIDPKLNPDNNRIPPLLIQPFVENAIKHGLLPKVSGGKLWIELRALDEDTLLCTVEDNGVGREQARLRRQNSLASYKSRGTELVENRKKILNEIGYDIRINTSDRPDGGTVVTIEIGFK